MTMTFQTPLIVMLNATVAEYVAWGQAISNAIAAVGLTKTADTGQVNWTTLAALPAAVAAGAASSSYEVWQFTDSLQASAPIFIRLDYGICNQDTGSFLQAMVGTASDGAGNITHDSRYLGAQSAYRFQVSNPGYGYNGFVYQQLPVTVASDGGGSLFLSGLHGANPSYGMLLLIERSRDFSGNPTSDGATFCTAYNSVWQSTSLIVANAGSYSQPGQGSYGYIFTGQSTGHTALTPPNTALEGNNVYTYPFFTGVVPHLGGPSKHLVGVWANDLPNGNQFQMSHYGLTATFRATGTYLQSAGDITAMSAAYRVA